MKAIKLGIRASKHAGLCALVDDADYEALCLLVARMTRWPCGYLESLRAQTFR